MIEKIVKKIKCLIYGKGRVDISGTVLTYGNSGKNCKGNGEHRNWRGKVIECCCEECSYMLYCFDDFNTNKKE